jgi:DNA invertase Pin-like site-specific DNA recombinase
MECAVEDGTISAVFVKDMSRLGRDYLKVGHYTDVFFPCHDVRFVAINDGVDSDMGENEFAPFRNIMNEWYAKDASKKAKTAHRLRGAAGEPIGHPPYGYKKDPDNAKRWVIDPEAAAVVKRIFSMTLDGKGIEQVAARLTADKILTPTNYWKSKGIGRAGKKSNKGPYCWQHGTIANMLAKQEYCGDIVNFKTYAKSFRQKNRKQTPPEDRLVFKDVHEPIIERSLWEQVQARPKTIRRKKTHRGNTFSGLLRCGTCGSNLHFHNNYINEDIKYFNCPNYGGALRTCTSTHYIRVDFLERIVLNDIRRIVRYANLHEDEFVRTLMSSTTDEAQQAQILRKERLRSAGVRSAEIDKFFEKMYEDNALGKISDERFAKMSENFNKEQTELAAMIARLEAEIADNANRLCDVEEFVKMVQEYSDIKKLTRKILYRFVEKIVVHQTEKVDGKKQQRLDIYYNAVGTIKLPTQIESQVPAIEMKTRKGVIISYSPTQNEPLLLQRTA